MPLTLDEYAARLASRDNLTWPTAPKPEPVKAKPHLPRLPVKAVLWTVYGTLVNILQGELLYEHPKDFVTGLVLEKTISEFNMWNSMSRKPGQPSEYMREIYKKELDMLKMTGGPTGERYPEVLAERVWESIIKKLFQKDYKFDAGTYGSLNEYSKKVAYFYHASLQGTACYPGATEALRCVCEAGLVQGVLADAQCFTMTQLRRGLQAEDPAVELDQVLPAEMRILSFEHRARKPSETLFKAALATLAKKGIEPDEVLHVGSHLTRDVGPAKKFGMKTALFAGDKGSLSAIPDQLKDPQLRPDALLTELPQIAQIIG